MDGLNYEPAFRLVQGGDYIRAVNGEEIQEKEELIESCRMHMRGERRGAWNLERDGGTY